MLHNALTQILGERIDPDLVIWQSESKRWSRKTWML